MKKKFSFIFNIIIFVLVIISCWMMFSGFKFMHGPEPVLESTKLGMFRFFTVDSNIFMGIASLFFIIFRIKNKTSDYPKWLYVFKMMATSAVTLTFLVVFLYLGPITEYGIIMMLQNSNLFFHLIIPVLSIITFIFFENTKALSFKDSFYGILPCFLYSLYYVTNVLVHMNNGKVSTVYDWYWLVQKGVWTALIVAPLFLIISYIISFILWKLNKR